MILNGPCAQNKDFTPSKVSILWAWDCGAPPLSGPETAPTHTGGGGRAVNIVCMYRMFIYGVQFDNVYKFIYKNYTDLREDYLNTLTEADIWWWKLFIFFS
jgi:hypothetical protein